MGYIFDWDSVKAEANVRKHSVSFDEATTVFGDPLNLLMADPDAQGANVVVIDPDILDVFPTSASVNEALRALATVLRHNRRAAVRRRSA